MPAQRAALSSGHAAASNGMRGHRRSIGMMPGTAAGIALAALLVAGSLAWDRYGYLFPIEEISGPPVSPAHSSAWAWLGPIRAASERDGANDPPVYPALPIEKVSDGGCNVRTSDIH